MEGDYLETREDPTCRDVAGNEGGLAVEASLLGRAKRLECIGKGKRDAGQGFPLNSGLGFWDEQTDIDTVGGMEPSILSEKGVEIGLAAWGARRIEGAVERTGI